MQDQGIGNSAGQAPGLNAGPTSTISPKQHEGRTVWIITGYAASALALLGVLAYYFSAYVSK